MDDVLGIIKIYAMFETALLQQLNQRIKPAPAKARRDQRKNELFFELGHKISSAFPASLATAPVV
jgi:hypothetical protein